MFLIDTVTLSDLRRRQRDPMVVAWFERQRTTDLFLSIISIGRDRMWNRATPRD